MNAPWPAYNVEQWELSRLVANPRNARRHPKRQIEQIRQSLREFGWTMPVLAREDGTLIAGHGRVEAAKLEGHTHVPTICATGWTEQQCIAYGLIDNKLAELSSWDQDLLALEVTGLKELGVDLSDYGFKPLDDAMVQPQLAELKYAVIVRCEGEAEQTELLQRFEQEGLKCEALIS